MTTMEYQRPEIPDHPKSKSSGAKSHHNQTNENMKVKQRFHILPNFYIPTSSKYTFDAFTNKAIMFIFMVFKSHQKMLNVLNL